MDKNNQQTNYFTKKNVQIFGDSKENAYLCTRKTKLQPTWCP